MKRGVGYCETVECEDFLKGTFLLNHGDTWYCPRCGMLGFSESERKESSALPGNPDTVYKTVRVHFNFEPASKVYREIGIVDINELKGGDIYNLYSPLIKTEQRALKVAQATMCALNSGLEAGMLSEHVIDISDPHWDASLRRLETALCERDRRVSKAMAHRGTT